MSNNLRNPDEYYRWPHSPEPSKRKFGIRFSGTSVFDISGFPFESQAISRGLRIQRKRQTTSYHSLLEVLINGYKNGEWLNITEITDQLSLLPIPEFEKRICETKDEKYPASFETLSRRAMRSFFDDFTAQTIEGDRWQFPLDYPVTKKQVEYTPYDFQDINPLHSGKFMLTNAGYVIAVIAKDPPSSGGKIVRNYPSIPINPVLG